MAIEFVFEAKSADGKRVKGKVKADSEIDVKSKLRDKGFVPLSLKKVSVDKKFDIFQKKIKFKELQVFLRQLSVLLKSGVPLLESLQSLEASSFSRGLSDTLKFVIKDIQDGKTFSSALAQHPSAFSDMMVNLVRAGEEAGVLDEVLDRISIFYEKKIKLQSKVKGALMYPVVTICVAVGALVAILVYVIPKFKQLFESQGQDLPAMTQFVVKLSNNFIENWYLMIAVILGVPFFLVFLYRSGVITRVVDEILLKIPLFGSFIQKSVVARMSRTMSTLLQSGLRINETIDITIGTMGNLVVDDHLKKIRTEILSGKPLSQPLKSTNFFPPIVVQMVAIGEKTGNLDSMLSRVADFYEEEVEAAAEQLTGLLEPLVIVFLGGLIGFLVVAMFLPIFNLGNAIV